MPIPASLSALLGELGIDARQARVIAALVPGARIWVVDVDERVLAFIDGESRRRGVEVRTLLVARGEVEVVMRNGHADVRDQRSRDALQRLVAPRWRLSFRRSPAGTALVATPTPADGLGPDDLLARHILERNVGKVGNTWPEGLSATTD